MVPQAGSENGMGLDLWGERDKEKEEPYEGREGRVNYDWGSVPNVIFLIYLDNIFHRYLWLFFIQ